MPTMIRDCLLAVLASLALCTGASAQFVSITSGTATVQDFDSLASSAGAHPATSLPNGWYLHETSGDTNYTADNGGANSGTTYSYGATGSSERALGILRSGSNVPTIGARLQNNTGADLNGLQVSFTGEQWRTGARTEVDRLDFEYSLNATSISDPAATWVGVDELDFVSPVASGAVNAAVDGNSAANRTIRSHLVAGIAAPNGGTIHVRWTDFSVASNDDGLAIDDVSFAVAGDFAPSVTSSSPTQGQTGVAVSSAIHLTFSENVTVSAAGISLLCNGTNQPLTLSGANTNRSLTPTSNLPFSASCALTVPAASVTDLDGTPDPMAADFVLNFQTGVDNPPTLQSSVPANGAVDFPVNANLQLTFSEPVAVGATWFQIACGTSGTRQVQDTVVSGGPVNWTINPDVDFSANEACSLQLAAAQITDLDGSADPLGGNATIGFTAVAAVGNPPPVVIGTTPTHNSATFPSAAELKVSFSEPVTLSAGAFALSCAQSTGIVLTHAVSGTDFVIGTGTALTGNDACSFTIESDAVVDAMGAHPSADTVVNFLVRDDSVANYYAPVNTSSPGQLRCTIHQVIRNHTVYPYTASGQLDTWDVLEMADEDPNNSANILDVYRNESYPKVTGGNSNYNREHTWPNSLGFPSTSLAAYTDTHMLYLSHIGYNSDRGNNRYQNCSSCTERATVANNGSGGGSGVYPGNSNWFNASQFEVWNHRKGDMARAVMYMALRYEGGDNLPDLELTDTAGLITGTASTAPVAYMGLLSTLLQWHQMDPPDPLEVQRSQVVFNFQGNRNPFIDHPEWATAALFASTTPATCEPNGGNLPPVANDDNYNMIEDASLTVLAPGVLGNDSDPEGNPIIAELVSSVGSGALSFAANGGFIYTPDGNFCGNDAFTYRARDATGSSAVAMATIAVACVNDAPVASDASFNLAENSAVATVVGQVVASDVDTADTLAYAITAGNGSGAFSISASGQIAVANTTPLDFEATPQFVLTVTVSDNGTPPRSTTATITINLTNVEEGPATAVDDSLGVDEDSIDAVLDVLANDTPDPDGDAFAIIAIGTVAHGMVSFDAGAIRYSPSPDYCGSDSVTYTITGGNSATVAILVACVNDAPVAVGTLPDRSAEVAVAIVPFSIVGGFDDPDFGDTLGYSATGLPPGLALDPVSGMVSGTVLAGGAGASPYSVVITATDGGNLSVTQGFEYVVAPSADQIFSDGFED